VYSAIIRNSPWAKFTMRMTPKTRVRPTAMTANTVPVTRPFATPCSRRSSTVGDRALGLADRHPLLGQGRVQRGRRDVVRPHGAEGALLDLDRDVLGRQLPGRIEGDLVGRHDEGRAGRDLGLGHRVAQLLLVERAGPLG